LSPIPTPSFVNVGILGFLMPEFFFFWVAEVILWSENLLFAAGEETSGAKYVEFECSQLHIPKNKKVKKNYNWPSYYESFVQSGALNGSNDNFVEN
jgi:hypothetical protein